MSGAGTASPYESSSAVRTMINRIGRFVFGYRDYLVPAGLILVLAATRPQYILGSAHLDRWMDVLGVAVAAMGQAVRVLVIGYAYVVRGGVDKQLAAPVLVREGFYAHSRNPMYFGNILLLVGLALIYNSLWVYLLVLPLFLGGIFAIIWAEEDFLAAKFGAEYEDYRRHSNRFVPNPIGLRQTLSGMQFDWRRVLRKEYGTTFAWTSVALLLMIWQRLVNDGYTAHRTQIHYLLLAYVPLAGAWATVRWLKKSHRLDS